MGDAMTTIIGITARKGVGKSTLATMLKDIIADSEIVAFADGLKDDVADMLTAFASKNVSRKWLEDHKADIFGPLCQGYGEFARQWYGPTYWIDAVADYIQPCEDDDTVYIIPDVRHINEAEWIKSQGGLLVSVYGPSRWEGDTRSENHASERYVEACQAIADIQVPNTGTLEDLEGWARVVVERSAAL